MPFSDSTSVIGGSDPGMQHATAGDALLAQGKYAEARERYAGAIACNSGNARYHWQLGVCDDKLGRGNWAMESFQRAARLDPKFAFAHASMGSWFLNNGLIEAALESSQRALELMPGNHSMMELRARVLEVAGREAEAWQAVCQLL